MKHYFNEDKTKVLVELDKKDIMRLRMFTNSASIRYTEKGKDLTGMKEIAKLYFSDLNKIEENMKYEFENQNN